MEEDKRLARNSDNRYDVSSLDMDNMVYSYVSGTNKLDHINDSASATNYTTDIDDQSSGNYKYDSIGELISDDASNITNITWTVYGKIASITKSGDITILFTYDAGGNRISKSVVHAGETLTTWYVRDAQGNVLSVYTYGDPAVKGKDLTQTELHVYGSSRLGILKTTVDVEGAPAATASPLPPLGTIDSLIFTRGNKLFELTNHLGNVLATISDKRYGVSIDDSTVTYFIPEVVSANDYYPFGSLQPNRSYTENGVGSYRYGFNGKEKDDEVKGNGDQIDYGMRVYDPRAGKFLSVDPFAPKFPELTPYQYASNRPIDGIDRDGLEYIRAIPKFSYDGKAYDYASAIDNGVIDVLNLVPTTWNSIVSTFQSVKRGTYGEDLRRDTKQAVSGIKQAAVKAWNEPLKTLSSPEALELAVSAYITGKLLPTGGGKGSLLTPAKSTVVNTTEAVAARGISGASFTASTISKVLTASEEDVITLYRGTSGVEGQGTLFLSQDVKYATAYAKQNGTTVSSYQISRSAFNILKNEGLITVGDKSGVLVNAAGKTIATGGEVSVSNQVIKDAILNSKK